MAKAKTPGTAVAKAKPSLPANVAAEMAAEIAAFQNRLAAPSGDRIKVSDKVFSLPNGDTADTLSVIIVDFVSFNAYYDTAYNPNAITPPKCFSLGLEPTGLIPSGNSPEIQAESCAACWANQWKSGNGNGKACQNRKLLALLAPDGDMESPLMILSVSATALKSFDSYVAQVARTYQRPPRGVITTITCDPNVKYDTLRFSDPVPCTQEQLALAYARKEEAMQRLMVEPDVSQAAEETPAPKGRKLPAPKKPMRKAA